MLSESVRLFRKQDFTSDFDIPFDIYCFKHQPNLKNDATAECYKGLMPEIKIIHLSRTYAQVLQNIIFAGLSQT